MALLNTTIINIQDEAVAKQQYDNLNTQKCILMVVLGDSENIAEGVSLADELADTSPGGFTRKVMWVKDFVTLRSELEPYLTAASIIEDDTPYEEIKVFCLSLKPRRANSRIHKNGQMTFVKLEKLYVEAESQSIDQ